MAGSYGRSALLCLVLAAQAAADGVYPFSDGIATYQVTSGKPPATIPLLMSCMTLCPCSGNALLIETTCCMAAGNIADPAAYSKGTPLQAYLVPQDPYYSAILPFLQPPLGGAPQLAQACRGQAHPGAL